jgi:hypothetical protein
MDISLQSLLFFIIITIIYFAFPAIGKPSLTVADLESPELQADYHSKSIKSLVFYLGMVVASQFFLNIGYLIAKCGGSINKNIGSAAIFTFIPWILIFGVMLAVLLIFPGFKGAFSDVIGYYVVAGRANNILSSVLKTTDFDEVIKNTSSPDEKEKLSKTADALTKILGNKGILINQMNPENFLDIWKMLIPLMKPDAELPADDKTKFQQDLLNLVVLKDNIGEGLWYIYTAILISSIVYYNLATKGCVKDVDQIKADHDAYIEQQEAALKQEEINNSTVYTIS